MQARDVLTRSLQGIPLSGGEPLRVNGLEGYTAVAREVGLPWGNRGPLRTAAIDCNGLTYLMNGGTRLASAFGTADPVLLSSIKTFRRLRDNELHLAEPNRITLVKAVPGTSIEALAAASPLERYPAERLRLLNDLYPNREPAAGQWVKVVE
jgi:predicted Zn-dependent protease